MFPSRKSGEGGYQKKQINKKIEILARPDDVPFFSAQMLREWVVFALDLYHHYRLGAIVQSKHHVSDIAYSTLFQLKYAQILSFLVWLLSIDLAKHCFTMWFSMFCACAFYSTLFVTLNQYGKHTWHYLAYFTFLQTSISTEENAYFACL